MRQIHETPIPTEKPGHDRRQRAGDDDLAEDGRAARAQAGGRPHELPSDASTAVDRVEHDRKERRRAW